jgi:hypothetical protein
MKSQRDRLEEIAKQIDGLVLELVEVARVECDLCPDDLIGVANLLQQARREAHRTCAGLPQTVSSSFTNVRRIVSASDPRGGSKSHTLE